MAIFFKSNFKENVGCGLRGYSVTWCPLGLEAELIRRERANKERNDSECCQSERKKSPTTWILWGIMSIISTAGTCYSWNISVQKAVVLERVVLLFVVSQIYWMLSIRTCDVFMQRLMPALKENSSAQVIPRKEENSYTTKHTGIPVRVGFLTKQASCINSKENTTSFLETEYPSDIGQKSWLGKSQHTPCSRGKVMTECNHGSVLLHQKKTRHEIKVVKIMHVLNPDFYIFCWLEKIVLKPLC